MRLLLVEDDPAMVRALSRGLRAQGYAVDVASDGDDALEQTAVSEYDAVILDLMLPVRDGFEVCRSIRSSGSWVPILMLTARAAVDDRIRGLDAGSASCSWTGDERADPGPDDRVVRRAARGRPARGRRVRRPAAPGRPRLGH